MTKATAGTAGLTYARAGMSMLSGREIWSKLEVLGVSLIILVSFRRI